MVLKRVPQTLLQGDRQVTYSEIDLSPAEIIAKLETDVVEMRIQSDHYFDKYRTEKRRVEHWQTVAQAALEVIKHLQSVDA